MWVVKSRHMRFASQRTAAAAHAGTQTAARRLHPTLSSALLIPPPGGPANSSAVHRRLRSLGKCWRQRQASAAPTLYAALLWSSGEHRVAARVKPADESAALQGEETRAQGKALTRGAHKFGARPRRRSLQRHRRISVRRP
jgi:hypothetical protein